MLRNYVTVAFRHLWRNRLFTFLNILGLAIGISACWLIYQLVSYEFSFDRQQPNKERIYRVVSRFLFDGKASGNPGSPVPLPEAVRAEVTGVEKVIATRKKTIPSISVPQSKGKPLRFESVKNVVAVDHHYFALIAYRWLAGEPAGALSRPNTVVLAQSRAEQYFPGVGPQQVLGRTVAYSDTLLLQVTGVVANPDRPTDFSGEEFISLSTLNRNVSYDLWGSVNAGDQLWVLLHPQADPQRVEQRINRVSDTHWSEEDRAFKRWHVLQPLADRHFNTDYPDGTRLAHKPTLYGLMGIAVFLLALACINYINLATAQIPQRAREIGIRKTLGGRRTQLVGQFLGETGFVAGLALLLSFGLTQLVLLTYGDLIPEGLERHIDYLKTALFLLALVTGVSLLSGFYPGLLIARFQPVRILRGLAIAPVGKSNRITLRKSLIVFQFIVAQAFIVGALIIGGQLRYTLEKDLGFDKEAVVLVDIPWKILSDNGDRDRRFAFKEALKAASGIAAVTLGDPPAYQGWSSNNHDFKGPKGKGSLTLYRKYADADMVPTYRMKLLAGRNLLPSDTVREYVVNETCVRRMGYRRPQDVIGKTLKEGSKEVPIVGVVRDFHTLSLHEKINPVALMTDKDNLGTLSVKMASRHPDDWATTIREIEGLWKKFYSEAPFEYKFYDDSLMLFYKEEQKIARIINLATVISIVISCLGLFGLATFTAQQRTKEIGVRKVLGASVAGIVTLLSKDFLKLVLVAVLIASPIAWYAMSRWLENFAYPIALKWTTFALAGALAVVIALLTVAFQSIKAALTDPVKSLRSE